MLKETKLKFNLSSNLWVLKVFLSVFHMVTSRMLLSWSEQLLTHKGVDCSADILCKEPNLHFLFYPPWLFQHFDWSSMNSSFILYLCNWNRQPYQVLICVLVISSEQSKYKSLLSWPHILVNLRSWTRKIIKIYITLGGVCLKLASAERRLGSVIVCMCIRV